MILEHLVRSSGRVPPVRCVPALAILALGLVAAVPGLAPAQPCVVTDNGTGTVDLPPPGCGYISPDSLHVIIDGLPPGTKIRVAAEHQKFFNVTTQPGGGLGGEVENFSSLLMLHMTGDGFAFGPRNVVMQAQCETHTAPRTPGDPVQSFDTDMFMLQGQLPPGDPDFDLLRITAGTGFGMPSPGHTTLTRLANGNWNIDSFFDIEYRIDFVGAPGGPLAGRSGSTLGTVRMSTGEPVVIVPPCTVVDNGTGTVDLPPAGCGYVSPDDLHRMIDGLPPGTNINIDPKHERFFNVQRNPGGTLGGEVERFGSNLQLNMQGTGDLGTYARMINMPMQCETHTAPRMPGDPVQSFDTDMFGMLGQLPPGDPDFDLLRITGGTNFGMPSPGHTTLTRLPNGDWNVDSFFDITYRIDFIGAPGGPFAGMSGSTTATIRMATGGTPTDARTEAAPKSTRLHQNVPNPFNPSTKITFDLATTGKVKLDIVDVSGRLVRHLVDANMEPRTYTLLWDGRDDAGRKVASGTYFARLVAPDRSESRSMLLVK